MRPTGMTDLSLIVGRTALVLDVLDDEPISVRRLAAEVGIPVTTAQRLLKALEANGRAEQTPKGWTAPSVDTLFAPLRPEDKDSGGCTGGRYGSLIGGTAWAA